MQNAQNKSQKWLTVSGRSKQDPSKHTHACVQWSHASVGLVQARPNHISSVSAVFGRLYGHFLAAREVSSCHTPCYMSFSQWSLATSRRCAANNWFIYSSRTRCSHLLTVCWSWRCNSVHVWLFVLDVDHPPDGVPACGSCTFYNRSQAEVLQTKCHHSWNARCNCLYSCHVMTFWNLIGSAHSLEATHRPFLLQPGNKAGCRLNDIYTWMQTKWFAYNEFMLKWPINQAQSLHWVSELSHDSLACGCMEEGEQGEGSCEGVRMWEEGGGCGGWGSVREV